jgi:hypothetical protein
MGTKTAPSRYDGYAKAEADEPLFTLLARDPMAPQLIRLWAAQRWSEHEDPKVVAEARQIAGAMEDWRQKHRPATRSPSGSSPIAPTVDEERSS